MYAIPAVPTDSGLLRALGHRGNAELVGALQSVQRGMTLPFIESPSPQAGFPSPAADYVEDGIDLNAWLISNPPATFCVRIQGDSMIDLGILGGDVVTVDRSRTPRPGAIVVAAFDGNIYIKRLRRLAGRLALCSENQKRSAD